ncbi:MAG: hypothetical protein WCT18_01020 [Patescibacteria group bacterium]
MFSIFKKNSEDQEENFDDKSMTAKDILSALSQIQKELDRLKLAVSGSFNIDLDNRKQSKAVQDNLQYLKDLSEEEPQKSGTEKVIEGVFDGNSMIGASGEIYDVPANYASKSKLVEGDILKLTINNLGAFVYKQIKPIDRLRKVGVLDQDPQNLQFYALADGKKWKLLTASVTYYKGEAGDEVVFLIPAEGVSRSAAVDNIIKK